MSADRSPAPVANTMYCLPWCRNVIGTAVFTLGIAHRADLLAGRLVERVELAAGARAAAATAALRAATHRHGRAPPPAPPLRPVPWMTSVFVVITSG